MKRMSADAIHTDVTTNTNLTDTESKITSDKSNSYYYEIRA